ncbi:MAG: hypothetical protein ACKVOJ_09915 [Sphingomonadaceae bacterium]
MVAFQLLLLVGYGYAHWLLTLTRRWQVLVHVALLATARLQLESAAMQNDQLRLAAIGLQQEAQERQRAAEGHLRGRRST